MNQSAATNVMTFTKTDEIHSAAHGRNDTSAKTIAANGVYVNFSFSELNPGQS